MLVGLALAVPEAHERMCTGTPWWQSWGKSLSLDCTAYAEKAPKTIIVMPSPAPEAPKPKAEIYKEQLKQFWLAANSDDTAFLGHLKNNGFELASESVCDEFDQLVHASGELDKRVKLISAWSRASVTCKGNQPLDAFVLDAAIRYARHTCPRAANFKTSSIPSAEADNRVKRAIAALDSWFSERKRSSDFDGVARSLNSTLARISITRSEGLRDLCIRAYEEEVSGACTDRCPADRELDLSASCNLRDNIGPLGDGWKKPSPEDYRTKGRAACSERPWNAGLNPRLLSLQQALTRWVR